MSPGGHAAAAFSGSIRSLRRCYTLVCLWRSMPSLLMKPGSSCTINSSFLQHDAVLGVDMTPKVTLQRSQAPGRRCRIAPSAIENQLRKYSLRSKIRKNEVVPLVPLDIRARRREQRATSCRVMARRVRTQQAMHSRHWATSKRPSRGQPAAAFRIGPYAYM